VKLSMIELSCSHCDGDVWQESVLHTAVVEVIVQCQSCRKQSRLRVDTVGGRIQLRYLAIPKAEVVEAEKPKIESAPIAEPKSDPAPARRRVSQPEGKRDVGMPIRQLRSAETALREIRDLLLRRSKDHVAFGSRNTILGKRIAPIDGENYWAVSANASQIAAILNRHGGKDNLARVWASMKAIRSTSRAKPQDLTPPVFLTPGETTRCFLFVADVLFASHTDQNEKAGILS